MLPITLITIRESLEILVLISILFKASPNKHFKLLILCVSLSTLSVFFILYLSIFYMKSVQYNLHEFVEQYEHVVQLFVGIFLVVTGLLFHKMMYQKKESHLSGLLGQIEKGAADFSLFVTLVALILLEGSEIIVLSFPLRATYLEHIVGLMVGFGFGFLFFIFIQYVFRHIQFKRLVTLLELGILGISLHLLYRGITGILL